MDHSRAGRPTGRPCKLTPNIQARIVEAVTVGAYRAQAAQYAGIGVSTFYRWLETGEADATEGIMSKFRDLWEDVIKAETKDELRLLALITKAAETKWPAAAWRLERKHPERWGRGTRPGVLTPEEFERHLDRMEAELAELEAEEHEREAAKPINERVRGEVA
jgi:transposase